MQAWCPCHVIKEYGTSFITSDGGTHLDVCLSLRFSLPLSLALSLRLEEDEGVDLRNTVQPRTLSTEWKCCLGIQESQSLLSRNAESQRAGDLTLYSFFIQRNEAEGVQEESGKISKCIDPIHSCLLTSDKNADSWVTKHVLFSEGCFLHQDIVENTSEGDEDE